LSTKTKSNSHALVADRSPAILQAYNTVGAATPATYDAAQLAATIDHTLLKPEATGAQIRQLCAEAAQYDFASVCVNPAWVPLCAERLAAAKSVVCTVIGFPLGATLTAVKAHETAEVIRLGAGEVDMVLNIGQLKEGAYDAVYDDIAAVVEVAHDAGVRVKVIMETCLLTQEEKVAAALLTQAAGADFTKTSTGFNSGGATVADVQLLRLAVGKNFGVKAAGGVRSAADAQLMIGAGATRLGASAGVKIMESLEQGNGTERAAAAGSVRENETY